MRIKDNDGNNPLHIVSKNRKLAAAQYFLKKGADPNATDKDGNTPLHLVRTLEAVKTLVNAGALLEIKNNEGHAPIHLFSILDRHEIVYYLIEKGAKIDQFSSSGDTALHLACIHQSCNVVRSLISQGANINLENKKNLSAVKIAKIKDEDNRKKSGNYSAKGKSSRVYLMVLEHLRSDKNYSNYLVENSLLNNKRPRDSDSNDAEITQEKIAKIT